MNRPVTPPPTTAAEGLPRRCFNMAELEQMVAAGILHEDERIELIGGEIVPMSPKGKLPRDSEDGSDDLLGSTPAA